MRAEQLGPTGSPCTERLPWATGSLAPETAAGPARERLPPVLRSYGSVAKLEVAQEVIEHLSTGTAELARTGIDRGLPRRIDILAADDQMS